MKRLAVGILAHVDAGKTTLCEALLYRSGAIRRLGRVDHADAFLDTHALERRRGITIFAKQALVRLPDAELTLLDTPGHADFSPEAERTLRVLDYAVLVVNGAEGLQSHTRTLWRLLQRYSLPVFLFINKMDLPGADRDALMRALREQLGDGCVDFSRMDEAFYESLALCSEPLMEAYLAQGTLPAEAIGEAIARREAFPCYFGAALRLEGVDALLRGLATYTQSPAYGEAFGARVFKIADDGQGNRLTHLKITGGSLRVRTLLQSPPDAPEPWAEKVTQLRIYSGAKFQAVEEALPGMVCAVTGLTRTRAGEGLGAEDTAAQPLLAPVLSYRAVPPPGADLRAALACLRRLEEEEPQLHVLWNEALGEIQVQLMGEVQLEILQSLLRERFGMALSFSQGSIIYKETIAHPVEGMGHFEPLRHYAEVRLLLEPGAPGSGLQFAADCTTDALSRSWQRVILSHLAQKTHRGVLTGSPITDIKLTLIGGRAHQKHTEGGDFRQAALRAVRQGLRQAQSVLLEPWYEFRLAMPPECVGRAMTDLQRMQADVSQPQPQGEHMLLRGCAPVSALREYPLAVAGYTRGRGRLSCVSAGYRPCRNAQEVIERLGYDCDADVENPADSIFCAHGAGYVVKWDAVPAHMHTAAVRQPGAAPAAPARAPARPHPAAADDQALLRIFERTYGPLRTNPLAALRPAPGAADAPRRADAPPAPEYLLVDGYNIIFAWEELAQAAREDIGLARSRLLNLLCNYRAWRGCEVILVFDAYKVKGNPGTVEHVHNIHVVYTREAETADMYIEKATNALGGQYRVRVATSDRLEQLIILGHGAERVSARAFREEVAQVEAAIAGLLAQQAARRGGATLGDARILPPQ